MATARQLPGGGYEVTTDAGRTFPTAYLPPGVTISPQMQAALAPQPDMRTAGLDIVPSSRTADTSAADVPLGNPLTNAMGAMVNQASTMDSSRTPLQAAQGAYNQSSANWDRYIAARNAATAQAASPGALIDPSKQAPRPDPNPKIAPKAQAPAADQGGELPAQPGGVMANRPQQSTAATAPAYQVIKGGERKTGEVMQTTTVDPAAQKAYGDAMDQRARTMNEAGAQAKGHGDAVAGIIDRTGVDLARLDQQRQAAEAQRQEAIARDVTQLDQLRQEAKQEVDPERIFRNRSTGKRFMDAIALGLSELGAGLTGRTNSAMQLWMKLADDDIAAQAKNIEGKRAQVGLQQGVLAANRERFADERQAELATKAGMLEWAQSKIEAEKQYAQSDAERAKYQALSDELEAEKAKTMMSFGTTTHQIHTAVVPDRVVGGPATSENLNRELVVEDLHGNKFLARNGAGTSGAGEVRKARALTQGTVEAANEMRQIANMPGFDKLDPSNPAVQRFNFARERFINGMNTLQGQGVVRNEDVQRYTKDVLGGPYGLSTAKMAQNAAQVAATGYSNILAASADMDTPVTEGFVRDPRTGTVKKVVNYDLSRDRTQGGGTPSGDVGFKPAGAK